jgi:hypothetical protein
MTAPKVARRQHLAPKPTVGVIGPSFDQVANRARRDTRFVYPFGPEVRQWPGWSGTGVSP